MKKTMHNKPVASIVRVVTDCVVAGSVRTKINNTSVTYDDYTDAADVNGDLSLN
jgi:hypothetical protein